MNTTIFVTGLPKYLDKELLSTYFHSFGEIHFIRIFTKENNQGKTEGFAKIKFKDREGLLKSTRSLTHTIGELVVKVRELKTQAELESQISKKSRLIYVTNVHYGTKKAEFKKFIIPKVGARRVVRMIKNKKGKKQKEKEMEMFGKVEKIKSAVLELNYRDNRSLSYFTDLEIDYRGKRLCFKGYEEKEYDSEGREIESRTIKSGEQEQEGEEALKSSEPGEPEKVTEEAKKEQMEQVEDKENKREGQAPRQFQPRHLSDAQGNDNDNNNKGRLQKKLNTGVRQFNPQFIIPHLQKKVEKTQVIPVDLPSTDNEHQKEEEVKLTELVNEEQQNEQPPEEEEMKEEKELEEGSEGIKDLLSSSKFQKRKVANVVHTTTAVKRNYPRIPTSGTLRYQEEDANLMFNFPLKKAETYKQAIFIHKQLKKARKHECNEPFFKDIKIEISYSEFVKYILKQEDEIEIENDELLQGLDPGHGSLDKEEEDLGPHGLKPTSRAYFSKKAERKANLQKSDQKSEGEE